MTTVVPLPKHFSVSGIQLGAIFIDKFQKYRLNTLEAYTFVIG